MICVSPVLHISSLLPTRDQIQRNQFPGLLSECTLVWLPGMTRLQWLPVNKIKQTRWTSAPDLYHGSDKLDTLETKGLGIHQKIKYLKPVNWWWQLKTIATTYVKWRNFQKHETPWRFSPRVRVCLLTLSFKTCSGSACYWVKAYLLNTRVSFLNTRKKIAMKPESANMQKRSSNVILKFSRIPRYFLAKKRQCKLWSVQIIICESRKRKYSRFGVEIKRNIYLSLPNPCRRFTKRRTTIHHVRAEICSCRHDITHMRRRYSAPSWIVTLPFLRIKSLWKGKHRKLGKWYYVPCVGYIPVLL